MCRMCGARPAGALRSSARRWLTPKRCCSSTTATARRSNSTGSSISACVPTSSFSSPLASLPSRSARRPAGVEPVSSAAWTSSPGISFCSVAKCCSASVSVGAISAAWAPDSTARSIAYSATTVLPEPTSPISSRCIGRSPTMSSSTAAIALRWSPVGVNGSESRSQRSVSAPGGSSAAACAPSRRRARRRRSAICSSRSSSNASRRRPPSWSPKWAASSAAARSGSRSSARIRAGSGSSTSRIVARCSWTSAAICTDDRPSEAG